MAAKYDEIMGLGIGDRVVVLNPVTASESGRGHVMDLGTAGYVGVRFDGESGWYEWPASWCWGE